MDFLGVGPLELIFILIIALIVMGPNDMVKTGRTIGVFLRKIIMSPTWRAVQQTSKDIRYLPNKLIREAGLEEQAEEMKKLTKDVNELGKIQTDLTKDINKINADLSKDIDNVNRDLSQDLNKVSSEVNQGLAAWTTPPISPTTSPSVSKPKPENTEPPSELPSKPETTDTAASSEPPLENPPGI